MTSSVGRSQFNEDNLSGSLTLTISVKNDSLDKIRLAVKSMSPSAALEWINSKNERGQTLLAQVIEFRPEGQDKMEIVRFLVEDCKADVDLPDHDGWTPLYRASTGTRSTILEFLLKHHANPNLANKDGSTPLHRSADRGNSKDIQTLIAYNADVDQVNCFGTPLAYAAKNGNTIIADILLNAGADPNLVNDPLGLTPLGLALNNYKEEMAQLLRKKGALESTSIDSKVQTSLSKLVHAGIREAILESFFNGETDHFGRSVAHYCAHAGQIEMIRAMGNQGIDNPDGKGRPPFHYAIMKGHHEIVRHLMSESIQCALDSRDHQGYSPLMWACQYNQVEIASDLLERAYEQNKIQSILQIKDNFGWSALHKAGQVGNLKMVKMLIEKYKMDERQLTLKGESVLDLAKVTQSGDVVSYLEMLMKCPLGVNKV